MGSIKARKIKLDIPEEILQKDLALYREKALQLGATDVRIISAR